MRYSYKSLRFDKNILGLAAQLVFHIMQTFMNVSAKLVMYDMSFDVAKFN